MMKKLFDSLAALVVSLIEKLDFLLNFRALCVVPVYVRCTEKKHDSIRNSR